MSKALITEAYLTDIADAIRAKNGSSDPYTPPQMAAAIGDIPTGGITPTGTKQITQNGTHDVTQYASANVNVQPNLQSKTVTQNGTVTPDQGYDGLSSVVVSVPVGADIEPLSVTQNGTYTAPSGKAYSPVTVNVSGGGSVDPSLPSAYQEVEYITFDGNEFMLVEDLPTDYMLHILASNSAVTNECVAVGYREASNSNMDFEVRFQTNATLNLWIRSSTYGIQALATNPTGNVLNVIREAAFSLIGQSRMKFFIGKYSTQNYDYAFKGNLYALKLYEPRVAGKLTQFKAIRKFVPCYRISDGVIGVYEVYTSTFYQNEGTGTLAKGPDVT